ncbi:relaxase [Paracoccus sp. M683]|uniref:relaxase/mobilization nuclease domain-containing protein n=1 Tax=Paracoccus sp. M683 TaxID=2594268 RepID=UPI00117FAC4E|nr:relaxase/mobilization nuclease domain-containing protein [Paracoccus sp. M683]TRW96281.1 relaxase [Paracoccus sp. M683]
MILKGSQRSGALKLAAHLLNDRDNDHVELHELRGFMADDLHGALRESEAIAKGTRCRQHLFSLSFSPPDTERVSVVQFEAAIARAEESLGLSGHARAVIFHEKEGRRHAHVVWSRINVNEMKAVNLSFYKKKLNRVSKELFLEHGWRLPEGYRDKTSRNPLNFTLAEWQQARRAKEDAGDLKLRLKECWSVSDNRAAFEHALEDQGFVLARGDRRGFVAVDTKGEVYSLTRWLGVNAKDLSARIGDRKDLPSADQAKDLMACRMSDKLRSFLREAEEEAGRQEEEFSRKKDALRKKQRAARQALKDKQAERAQVEALQRAARFRKGIGGAWDWLSGRTRKIRKQNEINANENMKRDAREREVLISKHISQTQKMKHELAEISRGNHKLDIEKEIRRLIEPRTTPHKRLRF